MRAYETQHAKFSELRLFDPEGREAAEDRLARRCRIDPSNIILYCVDRAPGLQKVRHYIEDQTGRAKVLDEVHPPHQRIVERHLALWTVYVFVDPCLEDRKKQVLKDEAESFFGLTNELNTDRKQGMLF